MTTPPRTARVPPASPQHNPPDEDHPTGLSDGSRAVSLMVTGPLLYTAIGWAIDHFWLHTGVMPAIGLLVGAVLAGIMIYRRYKDLR